MKVKVTKLLSVIFAALTICGAIYVFYSGGKGNAGYAVIPMIFSLYFSHWTHIMKKHTQIK
jgi:hypothetical protein